MLAIALQAVSALRHAHRRGVLHGDLKPGNLIQAPDGRVKLAEAGIARLFGADVPPPGDNPLASAAFISPEQAAGKPADQAERLLLARLPAVRPAHRPAAVHGRQPGRVDPQALLRDAGTADPLRARFAGRDRCAGDEAACQGPQVRPGSGTLLLAEVERIWANLETRGKVGKRPPLPADDPLPPPAAEEGKALVRQKPSAPAKPPRPIMSRPYRRDPAVPVVCRPARGWLLPDAGSNPDDLWARAQPLMHSEDPADWEKAWTEYLEPLSREYPDRYADEIKAFRARTEPLAELRKAQAAGKAAKYRSEAERFYQDGVRLCQAGDFAAREADVGAGGRRVRRHRGRGPLGRPGPPSGRPPADARTGTLHRPSAATALRRRWAGPERSRPPTRGRKRTTSSTPWTPCTATTRTRPRFTS